MKPQDIVVALKLCSAGESLRYSDLSAQLGISASEVHAGVRRLEAGRLIESGSRRVLRRPFLDFLKYGLSAVFPVEMGAVARGEPTAWAEPELARFFPRADDLPVWPDAHGSARGPSVKPLHPSVPQAVRKDARLYKLLALVDGIRLGRARERNLAISILEKELVDND